MPAIPTHRQIIAMCGQDNYDKGAAYARDGKVTVDRAGSRYTVIVQAGRPYAVYIRLRDEGGIEPECGCLASLAEDLHCKHIAAALIAIEDGMRNGKGRSRPHIRERGGAKVYLSSAPDHEIVESLFGVFGGVEPQRATFGSPLHDDRLTLNVEFGILLLPSRDGQHTLSLELKLGLQKLYIVQRLADFLRHVDEQRDIFISKTFRYDPKQQKFSSEDELVFRKLIEMMKQDEQYHSAMQSSRHPIMHDKDDPRYLIPSPHSWSELLTALAAARNVHAEVLPSSSGARSAAVAFGKPVLGLQTARLPLRFRLDQLPEEDHYSFTAEGIKDAVVLAAYGMAFMRGIFYPLPAVRLAQLAKLKRLLFSALRDTADEESLSITHEQIERFMDKVIPSLSKLGELELSPSVAGRIWVQPLKARLYLDRIRGRLLAGLEFQYGDIVINPLENTDKPRGAERILLRDAERESLILNLFEQDGFVKTEGGFVMEGDDEEFLFLHEIVPRLEELLTVYATAAVKLRIVSENIPPKLHLTWDERTDWLAFKFKMDGITEKEIKAVVEAVEAKKPYYKLATGALLPLKTEAFDAMLRVMNGVGLHHLALHGDMARVPIGRAAALLDLQAGTDSVKLGRSLKELLDSLRDPERLDFAVPDSMLTILRDYQKTGYQWMKTLAAYRFGGILADEMGLGKTIQSIAYLLSVTEDIRSSGRPALIVSPASLMYNWSSELQRFAPGLRVVIADGSKDERADTLDWVANGNNSPDIVIVSYPLLRRDWELYAAHRFHTLILDEAQAFKNANTQTAGAVRALQAEYRFALTGTPIENRLDELWSIFRAVFPALFPDLRAFGELTREEVARRGRPFLMRRLKSEVLRELPEKIETLQSSELLPEQKKLYAAYLAKLREDSLKHLDSNDFGRSRIRILAGITRLRQLCCHPALFVEGYQGSSAKFEQLLELVEQCRSTGRRALVFSQFTEMLGLISRELGYRGVPYFYLDGSTPAAERVELCNQFNEGERDLFLLSLKAGGTGLNLTGADTVILYDLWWNPAVEQQAADRAHRIGQRKVVQIIRLISEGTVEDKMVELQQRKLSLIDDVLSPESVASSSLTEADLRELLSLGV
ncbi:DEAD/DEAH box helicase [Paenibacillus sp. strain BS8-2]